MGKETFAKLVRDKVTGALGANGGMYNSNTPSMAQSAIAEAITEYLMTHTTIDVLYNGVMTSGGSKDSVTKDTMTITGECATTGVPSSFQTWVVKIQSVIASSFSVTLPGKAGVQATFKPFNPTPNTLSITQSSLKEAWDGNKNNPSQIVWEVICGKILDWLNSPAGKNPSATNIPASRTGVSTGTVSIVSINVS